MFRLLCFSSCPTLVKRFMNSLMSLSRGKLTPYLPTEENNLLQTEVEEFDTDYFKMACDAIRVVKMITDLFPTKIYEE